MREPAAELHRPVTALRRIQHLAGKAQGAASDRNPNRAAQLRSIHEEIFDICVAALCGGPLPEEVDHARKQ